MFQDAYLYVKDYGKCKLSMGKPQLATLPLRPIVVDEHVKKWGIHFI